MVDSVIEVSAERLPTITLADQLIVGGMPTNGSSASNFSSNIAVSYRGCFRDLIINNQ